MADPAAPHSNDDPGVGPGRGPTRRRPSWAIVLGIILVKLGIIASILLLPSELGISLAAGHGVVLLVLLVAAVALVVYKIQGNTPHSALAHRLLRRHRLPPGLCSAMLARVAKNRGRK